MSAINEAAPAAVRRRPLLKRAMARLCGCEEHDFVLQIVQPSLVGMIDGTVSTLAPIFAAAVSSNLANGPAGRPGHRAGGRGQHGVLRGALGHR